MELYYYILELHHRRRQVCLRTNGDAGRTTGKPGRAGLGDTTWTRSSRNISSSTSRVGVFHRGSPPHQGGGARYAPEGAPRLPLRDVDDGCDGDGDVGALA